MHIIPEAGSFIDPASNDFPVSYCIMFVGMLLMLIMTKVSEAEQYILNDEATGTLINGLIPAETLESNII